MSDRYNAGLDFLFMMALGEPTPFRWMLLRDGYEFDPNHAVIDELNPTINEVSASGYTRLTLTGGGRSVNTSLDRIDYYADWPEWEPMATGQIMSSAVLYAHNSDDTDSVPIVYYPFEPVDTAIITPFMLRFLHNLIAHTS